MRLRDAIVLSCLFLLMMQSACILSSDFYNESRSSAGFDTNEPVERLGRVTPTNNKVRNPIEGKIQISDIGQTIWNRTYDTPGETQVYKILKDPTGGYFVLYGEITSLPEYNITLMRLDADGIQLWNRTIFEAVHASMIKTQNGGLTIMCTIINMSTMFGSIFLMHADSSGVQQWNKTLNLGY